MNSFSFYLCDKVFISPSCSRVILLNIKFQVYGFCLLALEIFHFTLLTCMVSDKKFAMILMLVLLQIRLFFSLTSFIIFCLFSCRVSYAQVSSARLLFILGIRYSLSFLIVSKYLSYLSLVLMFVLPLHIVFLVFFQYAF